LILLHQQEQVENILNEFEYDKNFHPLIPMREYKNFHPLIPMREYKHLTVRPNEKKIIKYPY